MNYKDNFNNKTILITGGAGFIGSNLAFYFQHNFPNSNIVIFDLFRSGKTLDNGNLKSFGHYQNLIGFKGEIICGDLNSKSDMEILRSYKFDYIFHFAAISDTRVYNQELVMKTNVNSFYEVLSLAEINSSTLVYASSAATYGSLASPQTVGIENPENPYGYSKLVMDNITLNLIKNNSKLNLIGLRFFNVYGEREYYKDKTSSMVIQLGHQILNNNSPRLFENSDSIFRDFIYIDDVIDFCVLAAISNSSGIFNVGTGNSRSFLDIVNILQKELNTKLDIEYFPNPFKGYQNHTQANLNNEITELNFSPKYDLEKGIKKYLPYIIEKLNAPID